jgi:hypothetical protein
MSIPSCTSSVILSLVSVSLFCTNLYLNYHADAAFAPAPALAQETAALMCVRVVPSQPATPPAQLTAATAAFELSSRYHAWAKEASGKRGLAEQISGCQSPYVAVSIHCSPSFTVASIN